MSGIRIRAAIAAAAFAVAMPLAVAQEPAPMDAMAMQEPIVIGDLTITQAWARATPPGAVTGAGYLTITSSGAADDRLMSIDAPFAEIAEVHEMVMEGDRMMMRPVADGLVIPAGETVVLQPGGLHLMFVELAEGFVQDTMIPVTLSFETAGTIEIMLIVYPIGSDGPAGAADAMGGMDMGAGAGP